MVFLILKKSQLKPSYRRLEIPQIGSGWIVTNSIFGLTRRPKDVSFRAMHLLNFLKKSLNNQLLRIRLAVCLKILHLKSLPANYWIWPVSEASGMEVFYFLTDMQIFLVNEGNGSAEAAFGINSGSPKCGLA